MKEIIVSVIAISLSQFGFAHDNHKVEKSAEVEGCYYAGIVYKSGEKHRVQESFTDPVTHKITARDAEPEIWQECVDGQRDGSSTSPRFYWKTLKK